MADSGLAPTSNERGRYFSRAWSLLTHDKGWVKPVLVASVADLVPVAGPLGTLGYKLEWARLLAWGADVSPKQKNVQVGACIASGWRGFLILLGWGIVMAVIGSVCSNMPFIGGLLGTLWSVFALYLNMVVMTAEVRATVYQKAGAGYSIKNIWEMCSRDAGGLLRILGWRVVCWLAMSVVAGLALTFTALGALPRIIYMVQDLGYYGYGYSSYYAGAAVVEFLIYLVSAFGPTLLVLFVLALVAHTLLSMVTYAAIGLWMRQFDVPAWGRSQDPLPTTAFGGEKSASYDTPVPVAPVAAPVAEAAPVAPVADVVPTEPAVAPAPASVGEPEPTPEAASTVATEAVAPVVAAPAEYTPDGSEVISVEPVAQAAPEPEATDAPTEDAQE